MSVDVLTGNTLDSVSDNAALRYRSTSLLKAQLDEDRMLCCWLAHWLCLLSVWLLVLETGSVTAQEDQFDVVVYGRPPAAAVTLQMTQMRETTIAIATGPAHRR